MQQDLRLRPRFGDLLPIALLVHTAAPSAAQVAVSIQLQLLRMLMPMDLSVKRCRCN